MSSLSKEKGTLESSKTFSARSFATYEENGGRCGWCRSVREQCEGQVALLKDKAHQSFMQVLQIQQLHEEELAILREEWQQRETSLLGEVESLRQEQERLLGELSLLERNAKRHSCDFGRELVIDNIDAILCEGEEASYLDESQLIQFKDLVCSRGGSAGEFVAGLRREIYRDCKFVSNSKTQIEKLFVLIKELKEEVLLLQQGREEATRKAALAENQAKAARNAADATAKEINFLSEQVKRLTADKLRLEKRVGELERAGFSSPKGRPNEPTVNHNRSPLSRVPEQEKSMTLLEESRSNISEIGERINQLNYAKFITPGESDTILQSHPAPVFKKKPEIPLRNQH